MHLPATLLILLSLTVSPRVSFGPTHLTVQVKVEPHDANRSLVVTLDSGEYSRSSSVPLEGAKALITQRFEWFRVPAGEYVVKAFVLDQGGHIRYQTPDQSVSVQ